MAVQSLADKTLTASAVALSTSSIKAAWVQVQGVTLTGTARVGDANITASRGATLLSAGNAQLFPAQGNANAYDLSTIYVLGTAGNVVSILYDTF